MNSDLPRNLPADEQAALWAARLEGSSLSAVDRAALDAWLAADAGHRTLLSQYCQFSADLEVQLPALVKACAIAMPPRNRPPRFRWRFAPMAGVAMAAAALVVGFWIARPHADWENFASPPGQRQAFTLADGTRVELNAQTNLQFTNRGGERRAKLVAGEVLFMVSKDQARPFIVETPTGTVRVTGTTFDVNTEAKALEVTVVEGSVQVVPGQALGTAEPTTLALVAGDRLLAKANDISVRKLSADALDDVLAWRQGIVVFVDEPLSAAFARYAHYQGRSIETTAALAAQRVSGRYSLDDLDGFLSGVEGLGIGIRTTRGANGTLRVSLRSE